MAASKDKAAPEPKPTDVSDAIEATEDAPTQESGQPELPEPTSNNVGKQTMTKGDLGYDPVLEGNADDPKEGETFASPPHPDDPSHNGEDES